jgi:hypothetical protein
MILEIFRNMESHFFMIPDVVNVDGKIYDEVTICYLVIAIRPNRFNKNQLNLATLQIILTGR